MREKDPPPEELRCKRTDGRQWRCKRRAMDGKTLCDIHYLQGKHRQHKQKVPESLKLERNADKKKVGNNGESSRRVSKITKTPVAVPEKKRLSESLDEALRRMKLKRGDLHLELIRVFLKRQVEKKKEKEVKENAIADETRELPYGVMAISQSSPSSLQKFCESDGLDVKLGVDSSGNSFLQRHFRSKNIEPLPISTMQVVFLLSFVPLGMDIPHSGSSNKIYLCYVMCSRARYFEKQEVKVKCPACRGTCSCKLCMKQNSSNNHKDSYRGGRKLDRKQLLHYLVYMLLPVLKKVNHDQSIELETESKVTGKEESEIQIPQSKLGCHASKCCLSGSFKLKSCKKRKICSPGDELLCKQNISRQNSGGLPRQSVSSLQNWETCEDGRIPCPPTDNGGCGDSRLDLRCIFPYNWTRDLEVKAEEVLCSYHIPETEDVSPCCSLCNNIGSNNGEFNPHRELSRRIGFSDNYLYCPTVKDLHQENLKHFRSHWVKGHPVIVRNVLRSATGLCWDPVIMFCSYMENKSSESRDEDGLKARNCLDWCEVEIDRKRIFMGSLEKRTHASVRQKVLKFKAWLSSHLFQKQFPVHYNEILSSLPLPEYINPVSGLLNVSVKLPKEFPKPDVGPCIYFSYGGPEDLMQADYLSKLCYESHDTVNILAYATDAPISPEQISKIESLMKKYKAQDHHHGQQSFSNSSDQKGKSPLQSEDTGESGLQDIGEKSLPNGIKNVPFNSSDPHKGQPLSVENGNLSDDTESDDEASILCCGSIENSEDFDEHLQGEDIESSCSSEDKRGTDSCGAQWDIFPRQDVPKLLEYLRRHSNELSSACSYSKHVHPILDQNFFLDAYHKLKLKEEFDIQPWSFEQCTGEAIFIPAGCPYQIRKVKVALLTKLSHISFVSILTRTEYHLLGVDTLSLFQSCVNVVLDFISPENATQCIQLNDQIRLLPMRHKAKKKAMEVEKMALQGISAAIEDICNLMPVAVDQFLTSDETCRSCMYTVYIPQRHERVASGASACFLLI
ncbi:hypothetical protein DH2020_008927 [Rehmannia glutinosa]|uniref:Lysine-specific demethylase JMJ25 n=1 Tax=Rehmannia glutinosa TaxID=99300 RepID=A0ABR0X816_REHGL